MTFVFFTKNKKIDTKPFYVHKAASDDGKDLSPAIEEWQAGRSALKKQTRELFIALTDLGYGTEPGKGLDAK